MLARSRLVMTTVLIRIHEHRETFDEAIARAGSWARPA